jgi:hypothetical protein
MKILFPKWIILKFAEKYLNQFHIVNIILYNFIILEIPSFDEIFSFEKKSNELENDEFNN